MATNLGLVNTVLNWVLEAWQIKKVFTKPTSWKTSFTAGSRKKNKNEKESRKNTIHLLHKNHFAIVRLKSEPTWANDPPFVHMVAAANL